MPRRLLTSIGSPPSGGQRALAGPRGMPISIRGLNMSSGGRSSPGGVAARRAGDPLQAQKCRVRQLSLLEIVARAFPVDDQEVTFAAEDEKRIMPHIARIVDALPARGAES